MWCNLLIWKKKPKKYIFRKRRMLLRSLRKYSSFIVFLCSILSWSHRSHCQGHLLAVMRHSTFQWKVACFKQNIPFASQLSNNKERVTRKRNILFIGVLFCNKGLYKGQLKVCFLKIKLSHIIRNRQIRKDKDSSWGKVKVKKWRVSQIFSAFDFMSGWTLKDQKSIRKVKLRFKKEKG